jgi:regulator of nonsense transcripts 1
VSEPQIWASLKPCDIEGAFTHIGNHLISDLAATIIAGGANELSNINPDKSLLYAP